MIDLRNLLTIAVSVAACSIGLAPQVLAKPIGADAPCFKCCGLSHFDVPSNRGPCPDIRGGSFVSSTNATMGESYPVVRAQSANGAGLEVTLYYASYMADGEKAAINTVMGFGWSHSYNIFLFTQGLDLYKASPGGLVTKYRRTGRSGPLIAQRGAQQTVAEDKSLNCSRKDPGSSIEIRDTVGGTAFCFEQVTGNPLRVAGVAPWMLKRITDRNGNVTELAYQGGLLQTVRDTYGRQISFEYTSNQLSKISYHLVPGYDAASGTLDTKLSYDGQFNLVSIEDPLVEPGHQVVRYEYNELHQIVAKTDKNGKRWKYLYDAARKPVGIVDPDGKGLFGLTNPSGWATNTNELLLNAQRVYTESTTTRKDGRGRNWRYSYDTNGYLKALIAPDGATWSYTYDVVRDPINGLFATLNVATETDPNRNTTSYRYDANGNRVKMTDASDHVTTYEYEAAFNFIAKITYPNGSVTTYAYDAKGNRIEEIRDVGGLNLRRTWSYNADGSLDTETVHNDTGSGAQATKYAYDSFGNLRSVVDPMGHTTQYVNDSRGNRTRVTDAKLHSTDHFYDELSRLKRVTDPLGFATDYGYDGNDNRVQIRKQVSLSSATYQTTRYQYDLRNRLIQETRFTPAAPLVTRYTYDDNDNRTSATDPRGKVTTFTYDAQNRLTSVRDALGNITQTAYDDAGNRRRLIDANGHYTNFKYDKLNRVTKEIRKIGDKDETPDSDDLVTQSFYDTGAQITSGDCLAPQCGGPIPGSGSVAYVIDPELKYTYFKYDKVNRRVMTIRKVGDTADARDGNDWAEVLRLDQVGNLLRRTDANGNPSTYTYDLDNLKITEANALNETTSYRYDPAHNLETVTAPNGNVTNNKYSERNELRDVSDSVGQVASYTYDGVGNRLTETDGNNNATTYGYDLVNRVVAVTDALGQTTTHRYDPANNLIQITDREGRVTCYRYDDINRRTLTLQKMGGTDCSAYAAPDIWTATEYDKVGNVTRLLTAKHNGAVTPTSCTGSTPDPKECEITRYAYDEVNRLKTETYPDTKSRTFTYDKAGNLKTRTDQNAVVTQYTYNDLYYLTQRTYPSNTDSFAYDVAGRMLRASRAGWIDTFAYDPANRVKEAVQNGKTVSYAYRIAARTRTVNYPGGRSITESTDERTRLRAINDAAAGPLVRYVYDPGNRVSSRAYANGTTAEYGYNKNNWITLLNHGGGPVTVAGFRYEYDREGNKRFEQKLHDSRRSEAYGYDDIYRLVDYKVGSLVGSTVPVPITQTHYNLDKLGNWDSKTKGGVTENRTHDVVNQLTSINGAPLRYDQKGNLIADPRYQYDYDEENRLIRVTRRSDARVMGEYRYDALSRRVAKIANLAGTPVETRYFYDDARIVEEQTAAGRTQATYVYGNYIDEVLTMQRGGQDYYYHQNALWSVAAVTNAAGAVVERYAYDAYGFATITDGAGVQVPVWDVDRPRSGIGNPWMFTGRQLDEESGLYYYRARYYDSLKGRFLQRDAVGYLSGMNLYEYVGSAPAFFVDPSGACQECGPDVTEALIQGLSAFENMFKSPSTTKAQRKNICSNSKKYPWLASDTWDFTTLKLIQKRGFEGCPKTEDCKETVWVGGVCWHAGAVNYLLWGKAQKLCGFPEGDALYATDWHKRHYAFFMGFIPKTWGASEANTDDSKTWLSVGYGDRLFTWKYVPGLPYSTYVKETFSIERVIRDSGWLEQTLTYPVCKRCRDEVLEPLVFPNAFSGHVGGVSF